MDRAEQWLGDRSLRWAVDQLDETVERIRKARPKLAIQRRASGALFVFRTVLNSKEWSEAGPSTRSGARVHLLDLGAVIDAAAVKAGWLGLWSTPKVRG